MKANTASILALTLLIFISSCQKESSSEENDTAQALGKWNISNAVHWWTPMGGTAIKDTFNFAGEGLYRDFRNDGKVYSLLVDDVTRFHDTANYKIDGSALVMWNSSYRDTAIIQKITNHELSLYKKVIINEDNDQGVLELWNNFVK